MRTALARAAGLAAALLLAGCTGVAAPSPTSTQLACTAVGADPGIHLHFAGNPAGQGRYHVCIEGECHDAVAIRSDRSTSAFAVHPRVKSADPIKVTVYAGTQTSGTPVTTWTVTPVLVEPNGPGCPPSVYQGQLVVPDRGTGG